MNVEQEIEGLAKRLLDTLEKGAYTKILRESFHPFVDLVERAPEEVPRVIRWALDALSPPAAAAILELTELTLDFSLGVWLPKAGIVTDAMTATLLGMILTGGGRDLEGVSERFDAAPLVRPLRYGFGIPKGIHTAIEGVFLNPLIFDAINLVHFLRHRRYVAESIPEIPFVGSIVPWDGWAQLEASTQKPDKRYPGKGSQDQRKRHAALGCVTVTLFGPIDVLEDISIQMCTDRELEELRNRLSAGLGLTSEDYLILNPYLERPSELPVATQNLLKEVTETLREVAEEENT
ncbi:MAG: hypothetical protein QN189_02895 [Armatimonadota bacterium]|nr:hypothetical protein [Armatimonadota bacterium]